MHPRSTSFISIVGFAALLQACAPMPLEESSTPEPVAETPEITLNLPEQTAPCNCENMAEQKDVADYTFLEKGFSALAEEDYVGAVQYFQRYQRLESSAEADWEAGIAIAFVSSLSDSPFYDAEAARKSFRQLRKQDWRAMQLHQQTLLMRMSLENSIVIERHVQDLEASNATLQEDLEKREEALKRLRELTLGQKGS